MSPRSSSSRSPCSLIRAENRTREAPIMATRARGVAAVAVSIGAVAIVGALVIGPRCRRRRSARRVRAPPRGSTPHSISGTTCADPATPVLTLRSDARNCRICA
jgi:hypothetical protein